ncbi:MAG: GNAT family N-acetyltransferase [Clostridiales bacterium]|nr:GNAT family N-acetyltransferase [Clostridiales bacterium]
MIREAEEKDFGALMQLYLYLHEDRAPALNERTAAVWQGILRDPNHHLIVCEEDGAVLSSCVCVVVPNLTRNLRPYALIENVVTHPDHRKRGLASRCLERAREIARQAGCYKIMLLTGSKDPATHRFYQRAGYNNTDKTAYIQWLD